MSPLFGRALARFAALTTVACIVVSCGGIYDLGTTSRRVPTDGDADAGSATADGTPPEAADATTGPHPGECFASGTVDRYFSAKDLADRLYGAWVQCPTTYASPLPCAPEGAVWGIRFDPDGTYVMLGGATFDRLAESPEPCGRGLYTLCARVEPDSSISHEAGAPDTGTTLEVARDDATPRAGIDVHLEPNEGPFDVELVDFESAPRRLFLREVGPVDSRAYFAPAPAPPH